MHITRSEKGYFDAFFVILIWSGFVLISRIGGKSELLSYDVVALRFGTAAAGLLPFWLLRNKVHLLRPKIIALAFTGGIGYCSLAYFGFKYAPVTHAAILLPGMLPFEATIFSWLLLHERPSKWRLTGLATIALGVVSLGIENFNSGFSTLPGDIAFVGAGTCWAFYSVLVRKWNVSPWDATTGSALISACIYLPIYWLFLPKQMALAPWDIIAIQAFYQGIMAMIVAMVFYMRAVRIMGPSKVGLCMALVPAISSIAAIPLLHEPMTLYLALGLTLTSVGAWVGNRG